MAQPRTSASVLPSYEESAAAKRPLTSTTSLRQRSPCFSPPNVGLHRIDFMPTREIGGHHIDRLSSGCNRESFAGVVRPAMVRSRPFPAIPLALHDDAGGPTPDIRPKPMSHRGAARPGACKVNKASFIQTARIEGLRPPDSVIWLTVESATGGRVFPRSCATGGSNK